MESPRRRHSANAILLKASAGTIGQYPRRIAPLRIFGKRANRRGLHSIFKRRLTTKSRRVKAIFRQFHQRRTHAKSKRLCPCLPKRGTAFCPSIFHRKRAKRKNYKYYGIKKPLSFESGYFLIFRNFYTYDFNRLFGYFIGNILSFRTHYVVVLVGINGNAFGKIIRFVKVVFDIGVNCGL